MDNYNEKSIIKFGKRILRFVAFQSLFRIAQLKYLFCRLKSKNGMIIVDVQGSKMLLDLTDAGISRELAVDGIREPGSTKEIINILKKDDVVVEIGANIGYYALIESKIIGKKGKIYAIEPSAKNVKMLKKNIELNSAQNIEVFELAIGDRNANEKMNISTHSNWNSLVKQRNKNVIAQIEVKVLTLDRFLIGKKMPDFIRMDVEGYEYNIIKGMKNMLKSKTPLKLFVELHPHIMEKSQTIYVLKKLMTNGFRTTKVIRSVTVSEMKVMVKSQYDYSHLSIKDIIEDNSIISGEKGAFEIFFERN